MSYIREIWFPNREHGKVFKVIFVLCLYAAHSCIFVSNAKHRRQPYPILSHKRHDVRKKILNIHLCFDFPNKICIKYFSC